MLPTLKQHIRVNRYSFAQKETFKAKLFFHWQFRDLIGYNPNRTYYTDNNKPKLNKWFDILGLLCMSYMGYVCTCFVLFLVCIVSKDGVVSRKWPLLIHREKTTWHQNKFRYALWIQRYTIASLQIILCGFWNIANIPD